MWPPLKVRAPRWGGWGGGEDTTVETGRERPSRSEKGIWGEGEDSEIRREGEVCLNERPRKRCGEEGGGKRWGGEEKKRRGMGRGGNRGKGRRKRKEEKGGKGGGGTWTKKGRKGKKMHKKVKTD